MQDAILLISLGVSGLFDHVISCDHPFHTSSISTSRSNLNVRMWEPRIYRHLLRQRFRYPKSLFNYTYNHRSTESMRRSPEVHSQPSEASHPWTTMVKQRMVFGGAERTLLLKNNGLETPAIGIITLALMHNNVVFRWFQKLLELYGGGESLYQKN